MDLNHVRTCSGHNRVTTDPAPGPLLQALQHSVGGEGAAPALQEAITQLQQRLAQLESAPARPLGATQAHAALLPRIHGKPKMT